MSHVASPRCTEKVAHFNSNGTVGWIKQCKKKAVRKGGRCAQHELHEVERQLEAEKRARESRWWRRLMQTVGL